MENVEDIYPLTPTQSGILYEVLNTRDPGAYFEQVRATVTTGAAHDPDWRSAWQALIDRHCALRTAVIWERIEEPVQVVREKVDAQVELIDLTEDPDPIGLLDTVAVSEKRRGFDLRKAPLSRVTVAKLAPGRWHLIWSFHHIIADGWSVGIVLDELASALAGHEFATQSAPQFRRHIEWLKSTDTSGDREFWQNQHLAVEGPTVPDLPGGTGGRGFVPARATATLDRTATGAIVDAARRSRVTPNVIVQGAWAACLGLYLDCDEVVFGVTMSGRAPEVADVENIVGMFLATLPIKVDLTAGSGWLHDIQAKQLDLLGKQHCSLADVQRWCGAGPTRPLFDSVLVFENYPRREGSSQIEIDVEDVYEQGDAALTLMIEVADEVRLSMLYDASRYGPDQVDQLVEDFLTILERLGEDPTIETERLRALSPECANRQLVELNDTERPTDDATLVRLWRSRVEELPHEVALVAGDRSWTASQLDETSGRIAAALISAGVGKGDRVGVHLERSAETVAALLGIVRLGAIYVPLDPTYPPSRLQAVVDDCEPRALVTASISECDLEHPNLLALAELASWETVGNLDPASIASTDAFYMTYTSGSTGVPKGVPGHHRAVIERCRWQWDQYRFEPGERVLARVTLNFVDHLWELWGALLGGATVVVADSAAGDPEGLATLVGQHGVRRLVLTPSLLSAIVDTLQHPDHRLATLRWVTVSGEVAPTALIDGLAKVAPQATLLNFYGMSEATADSTWFDTMGWDMTSPTVPIGRPIRNTKVYVLGRRNQLLPEGVVGRLHVSGMGLTHGYWNRPDLTAERFSQHPFDPAETIFDTGDLARWLPGGVLDYRGRNDDQVKIRGSRVELGDVEAALGDVAGVARCVAVAVDDLDTKRLVVFVEVDPGRLAVEGVEAAVLAAARSRLPAYMVPSAVVEVEAVPMTPNGKIDRLALAADYTPVPATGVDAIEDEHVADIAEVFSGVVGSHMGASDGFFDAGGHSLDAIRLAARLSKSSGLTVTLPDIVNNPTPAEMAAHLARLSAGLEAEDEFRHLVLLAGGDHGATPFLCVHGGGGHVLVLQELARHVGANRPFYGIQARGADGRSEPHGSVEEMAAAYVAELIESDLSEPYLLGGYSAGGAIALEMASLLMAVGRQVAGVLLLDTYHPTLSRAGRPSLKALARIAGLGPIEIARRLSSRFERHRRDAAFAELIEEGRVADEDIPEALRFERLNRQVAEAFWSYEPGTFDVPAVLLATSEINWTLEHSGPLRGWENSLTSLERIEVPGDHHKFLQHGAGETAASIEQAIAILTAQAPPSRN